MSAFIVDKQTMDNVITQIMRPKKWESSERRTFAGLGIWTHEQRTELGRMLYALNRESIRQRYGDERPEDMPGPCDLSDIHDNYQFAEQPDMTAEQGLKSINCLSYQCCEGNVPETSVLYKALEALAAELAASIVTDSPAYESAHWG